MTPLCPPTLKRIELFTRGLYWLTWVFIIGAHIPDNPVSIPIRAFVLLGVNVAIFWYVATRLRRPVTLILCLSDLCLGIGAYYLLGGYDDLGLAIISLFLVAIASYSPFQATIGVAFAFILIVMFTELLPANPSPTFAHLVNFWIAALAPATVIALVATMGRSAEKELMRVSQLEAENRRVAGFAEKNPLPVVAINAKGDVTYANPATYALLDDLGLAPYDFATILPDGINQLVVDCLRSGKDLAEIEKEAGHHVYLWSIHDVPEASIVYAFAIDITKRRRYETTLAHLATHDPLTNLPNRRVLAQALRGAITKAKREHASALLAIDLDHFKEINDRFGHDAGDQALIQATKLMSEELRAGDLLVRLGGDEFAVLLEGADEHTAQAIGERLRHRVGSFAMMFNGQPIQLGISIGVVPISGNLKANDVMTQADAAMYLAKQHGRNRVVLCSANDPLSLSRAN